MEVFIGIILIIVVVSIYFILKSSTKKNKEKLNVIEKNVEKSNQEKTSFFPMIQIIENDEVIPDEKNLIIDTKIKESLAMISNIAPKTAVMEKNIENVKEITKNGKVFFSASKKGTKNMLDAGKNKVYGVQINPDTKRFEHQTKFTNETSLTERITRAYNYYYEFQGQSSPSSTGGSAQAASGEGYITTFTASNGKTYKDYKQFIGSYANTIYSYAGTPIHESGCSITAIATILTGYGIDVNPGNLAGHGYLSQHFTEHGLSNTGYAAADRDMMMYGRPALVSISGKKKKKKGSKYYGGHYIAILDARGSDEVYISDPGSGNPDLSGWAKVDNIINIVNRGIIYVTQD